MPCSSRGIRKGEVRDERQIELDRDRFALFGIPNERITTKGYRDHFGSNLKVRTGLARRSINIELWGIIFSCLSRHRVSVIQPFDGCISLHITINITIVITNIQRITQYGIAINYPDILSGRLMANNRLSDEGLFSLRDCDCLLCHAAQHTQSHHKGSPPPYDLVVVHFYFLTFVH
ncbi:hypothetical protein OI72_22815 [Aeromonas hydrophila]|nr:hypothetical protein OI72_22815 [Aeromonas hydrophila]